MAAKLMITINVIRRSSIMLVLFVLSCATPIDAQQAKRSSSPSVNYGFVSPNTREDLKLEDAIHGMSSQEELQLLRQAQSLGCVVKQKISTSRALGSWSDGAEHSIMLRVKSDEPTIRYLVSRLGRDANQKAVIYFHPKQTGNSLIYIVGPASPSRTFASIGTALDSAGIAFRTLVPSRAGTLIYVLDLDRNLAAKVNVAARRLHIRIKSQKGNARFIGDDVVREKGQAIFAAEIKEYESTRQPLPPPCEGKQR